MYKGIGNLSFGKSIQRQDDLFNTFYTTESKMGRYVKLPTFYSYMCVGKNATENIYEMTMKKKSINHNIPIVQGCAILQHSKQHLLDFVYNFLFKYHDNIDLMIMDTGGSNYI